MRLASRFGYCIVISEINPSVKLGYSCFNLSVFHFPLASRRWVTRSFRDCKGKRSFGFCKENNFYFFLLLFSLFWGVQVTEFKPLLQVLISPLLLLPTGFFRWRAAKVNKLFGFCKIKMKFFFEPFSIRQNTPPITPFL